MKQISDVSNNKEKECFMNPSVAIIVVNYNGFEDTKECIKSIKECNYDNYTIIVVDNASYEKPFAGTIEYIKENAAYIEAPTNDGFAAGNNVGIKWAIEHKFDFCLLINNDTTVSESFLSRLIKAYESNDDAGIIGGRINFYSKPDHIWYGGGHIDKINGGAQHEYYNQMLQITDSVREIQFITGCLMLIPVKVIERVGLLDESFFLYEEDTEFCLRVMKYGYRLLYVDGAVIYHKISSSTQKNTTLKSYYELRNKFMLADRYYDHPERVRRTLIYKSVKDCIRGRRTFKSLIMAYYDYRRGVTGKR